MSSHDSPHERPESSPVRRPHRRRGCVPGSPDVQARLETTRKILKSDKSPGHGRRFRGAVDRGAAAGGSLPDTLLVGEESSAILRWDAEMRAAVVHAVREVSPDAREGDVLAAIDFGNHDATAPAYWTVDPIDGTKGFLRRGQYAVSRLHRSRRSGGRRDGMPEPLGRFRPPLRST